MIKLTKSLKDELVKTMGVDKDALDDVFIKAAGEAFANGKLTAERYMELTKEADAKEANVFNRKLEQIADTLAKLTDAIATKANTVDADKATTTPKPEGEKGGVAAGVVADVAVSVQKSAEADTRVKSAAERYASQKSAMMYPETAKGGKRHPFAGQPVMDFATDGHQIDNPSELDKALVGAYCKFLCATAQRGGSRTFGYQALPEHDKSLLHYALENAPWSGSSDGADYADIKRRRLDPREQKAVIDDAISGGLEAAPIFFDDQVIRTPLLLGELYPLVRTIPLTRGRRIEGVQVGNVTSAWGGVDDTAVTLFNTAAYVSAFDTTVFRWQGAIRIGLDFLSDSPIAFGELVTEQYGLRLLHDLDDVIAVGNGTTQPEGVMIHAGTTSVAWGGATSIGNYESLRFGVVKAEHSADVARSAVFCGTETSYSRMKAIPVGAADARRLFGSGAMGTGGYGDYTLMDRPYKINTSLTNQQVFYAIMARYRMYRREGLTIRTSTEGDTLIRNNEMLVVALARYGGQLERGACAAITSTAPA